MEYQTTITGKPATMTAATVLPVPVYSEVVKRAKAEKKTVSKLLATWITEKIEMGEKSNGSSK